ncbi:MAG: transketolase C-terminal domain-containing protein [Bdellovibrionota bacterium]
MSEQNKDLPRDVFIQTIYEEAKRNKNLIFLCCDLGAKALDEFRVKLPAQFIHTGISEQHMVDMAAGLAQCGKLVYVYAMAPFATFRCFEQIKVALGAMRQPVTVIGVGVGFGYDDAGPTHYATEDLSCMRTIAGMEVHTPADNTCVAELAKLTYTKPHLRYVRLDRKYLNGLYSDRSDFKIEDGLVETAPGKDIAILSSGFPLHTALKVRERMKEQGVDVGVIDVFRLKPLNVQKLVALTSKYKKLVTLEEHFLSGGFGSAILEGLNDAGHARSVLRLGVHDEYYFENGGRKNVHKLARIDEGAVYDSVQQLIK